jgi:hypothetical protein
MADTRRGGLRVWLFVAVALGGGAAAFLLPPVRQPPLYHNFADARTMAGIPNCLNVLSNAPFLVVGLMGLWFLAGQDRFVDPRERAPYAVFFVAACCTWFGSSCYHWSPQDATLAWDRLPMTLSFTSLLAAMISERISVPAGARLLWPLVAAGAASVWWWRWTGNLAPYGAAQYFSIVLIGLLLLLFPPSYTRGGDLLVATGIYLLAKVAEGQDHRIYGLTGWISGHTAKHLLAALAVYWVLRMLRKRKPVVSVARVASSPRPRLPLF